jgi:acetyltransferase-like isoleucine patch superfamily enzyme
VDGEAAGSCHCRYPQKAADPRLLEADATLAMSKLSDNGALRGRFDPEPDPSFEIELSKELRHRYRPADLIRLMQTFTGRGDYLAVMLRRSCLRALVRHCGNGLVLGSNVSVCHAQTFEIGNGVFIGDRTVIHGRPDGRCRIGNKVWIGAQSYLDARDLDIADNVRWGPGARALTSLHSGWPKDIPSLLTDRTVGPIRVEAGAVIGVNAILLPGVTVGKGSIVNTRAVVMEDVPAFAEVTGAPARIVGWREATAAERGDLLAEFRGELR